MITVTHPGRFGDILWSLPTVRAISEAAGEQLGVILSPRYGSIAPLLRAQPYIDLVYVDQYWQIQETAPITPREPVTLGPFDRGPVIHLGYDGWPQPTLAEDVYRRASTQITCAPLDLDRPWITPPYHATAPSTRPLVIVGWSEEHFELKVGLLLLLASRFPDLTFWWLRPWQGRYDEIDRYWQLPDSFQKISPFGPEAGIIRCAWDTAAALMATGTVFLGCLSALWVLANGLGLPTVICEPNPQRQQPVFWRESPKNHLVRGGDGKPTFDARHVGDVLQEVLCG